MDNSTKEKGFIEDVFGTAMLDYFDDSTAEDIIVHSDLAEDDIIPVSYLFRNWDGMPVIEKIAIKHCTGRILDIGAGSGCHSAYLQSLGHEVKPIDVSPGAIEVMKRQGLEDAEQSDFFSFSEGRFDTLLLLMNGFGLVASIERVGLFLDHARELLNPGGQIIFDSSDLIYIFEEPDGAFRFNSEKAYYGEVSYRLEYKNRIGKTFDWLFIDPRNLEEIATKHGFSTEVIYEGENYHYLFQLTVIENS